MELDGEDEIAGGAGVVEVALAGEELAELRPTGHTEEEGNTMPQRVFEGMGERERENDYENDGAARAEE